MAGWLISPTLDIPERISRISQCASGQYGLITSFTALIHILSKSCALFIAHEIFRTSCSTHPSYPPRAGPLSRCRPALAARTAADASRAVFCSVRRALGVRGRVRPPHPRRALAAPAVASACVVYGPLGTPPLERVRLVRGAAARGLAGTGQRFDHIALCKLVPQAPRPPRIFP